MTLMAFLLAAAPAAAPTCRTADPERLISDKARELGAQEYCQFRIYDAMSDVDGDKQEDFIVVFSLEGEGGGNDRRQYLALFPSTTDWDPVVREVARKGQQEVDSVEADATGHIVLKLLVARPSDPDCCPSGHGELRLRLSRGRLEEVSPSKMRR